MRLIRLWVLIGTSSLVLTGLFSPQAEAKYKSAFTTAEAKVAGRKVKVSAEQRKSVSKSRKSVSKSRKPVSGRGSGSVVSEPSGTVRYGPPVYFADGSYVYRPVIEAAGPTPTTPTAGAGAAQVARRAALSMELPAAVPLVGPDPGVNEWRMAVVGYPLWLWVDGPRSMSSSVVQDGIAVRLDARLDRLEFDMGDGNRVSCVRFDAYHAGVRPGTVSPSCGYTYRRASLPGGSYRVSATARWVVSWSALGESGTVNVPVSGSRDLPVGELQAVIVG